MVENIFDTIAVINTFIWSPLTLYLLLGAGILFTVWTKFSQFRILTHGYQVILGKYDNPDDPGAINHFQALSAALSATIGLGNIGGVALAVSLGGPGAVFWMWIVGALGMVIKSVEITLAMIYRNTDDPDNPHGGAMWVIQKTLGSHGGGRAVLARVLGCFFCVSLLVWAMTGGCVFQSWNVAELTHSYFGIPRVATTLVMAVLVGLVILGGIKRIGRVAGNLVPAMCVIYLASSLWVLAIHFKEIPEMLMLIVRHAFTPTAPAGAFIGGGVMLAFSTGMQRALFSNEAGSGSAPIAHSAAKTNEPAREGIVGGIGPFIDTLVICTMTALVILSTGTWNREAMGSLKGEIAIEKIEGELRLSGPADIAALPDAPDWNPYQPGSGVFTILEYSSLDDSTSPTRQRIAGQIIQTNGSKTVRWQIPSAWEKEDKKTKEPKWKNIDFQNARWVGFVGEGAGIENENIGVFRDFKGAVLTSQAFDKAVPGLGKWMVPFAAFLFAVSTMISWAYYGEQCVYYLFGGRVILLYKLIYVVMAVVGALAITNEKQLVAVIDVGTGWVLWANMIIVILMSRHAVGAINTYFKRLDAGEFKKRGKK